MKTHRPMIEVRIPGGELALEVLAEGLTELGAEGLSLDGEAIRAFFPRTLDTPQFRTELEMLRLPLIREELLPSGEITFSEADSGDWIARWRMSLGAIRIGKRLVIVPPGVAYDSRRDDLVIAIEPRMAFGTGEHATTRMALELLETSISSGDRVIDLGCGNGVLTIGALLLGAASVTAMDIEEESIIETRENVSTHGFSDQVVVIASDAVTANVEGRFNVLLANILANPILTGLSRWNELVMPQASMVLTGIQEGDEERRVRQKAVTLGWREVEALHETGWYAARFRRI